MSELAMMHHHLVDAVHGSDMWELQLTPATSAPAYLPLTCTNTGPVGSGHTCKLCAGVAGVSGSETCVRQLIAA